VREGRLGGRRLAAILAADLAGYSRGRMTRRDFIGAATSTALLPVVARAQHLLPLVGIISSGSAALSPRALFYESFVRRMHELGWEDGRNYRLIELFADEQSERLPALVRSLVSRRVDVIVVFGNAAIAAARSATATIPVVGMTDDLVKSGFAASMARPGGNITGVSNFSSELDAKRLALLNELVSTAKRIGVIADPATLSSQPQFQAVARQLNLDVVLVTIGRPEEIDPGLDKLESARPDAVNVLYAPFTIFIEHKRIIERLNRARLPAIYPFPEWAADGALFAYGPSVGLTYVHIAGLVDKILHGARPEDLPVEQPEKIDLVVNLRIAKALALTIPQSLLARADQVLE
jgi:putative tryptophan/tyrosine transport system substrate-binding protein